MTREMVKGQHGERRARQRRCMPNSTQCRCRLGVELQFADWAEACANRDVSKWPAGDTRVRGMLRRSSSQQHYDETSTHRATHQVPYLLLDLEYWAGWY